MRVLKGSEHKDTIVFYGRDSTGIKKKVSFPKGESWYYIEDPDGKDGKTLQGMPVRKVMGETKNRIGTYEADVSYLKKFRYKHNIREYFDFIEMKPTNEDIELRILHLDIEVWDKEGSKALDVKNATEPIISITTYDTYTKKYIIYGTKPCDITELTDKIGHLNFKLHIFKTEEELLKSLYNYIFNKETAPDLIVGWNIYEYDMKYIKNRAKQFNIWFNYEPFEIFDLQDGYKMIVRNADDTSLDYVGKSVLGRGKTQVDRVWKLSPELLYFYNYGDVNLYVDLDEKMGIIHTNYLTKIYTGTDLQTIYYGTTYVADAFFFFVRDKGWVLPNEPVDIDDEEDSIEGGYVAEPSKGRFEYVLQFDINGSYPGAIITHNISPETKLDGYFRKDFVGILPQVIGNFVEERTKTKEIIKREKELSKIKILKETNTSLKYQVNTFYGVFLKKKFRLFDKEVADNIVQRAKENILYIHQVLRELGYKLLYGDTDSGFVPAKNQSREGAVQEGLELEKILNERLTQYIKDKYGVEQNFATLSLDKVYSFWVQTGVKKRYAGYVYWEGKYLEKEEFDVKGFEIKRRGNSTYTKMVQKQMIDKIREGIPQARQWYNEEKQKWLKKSINRNDIGILQGIRMKLEDYKTKNPAVKALENSKKYHISVDEHASRIKIYYLTSGEPVAVNKNDTLPMKYNIDYKEHMRICFEQPLSTLVELFHKQNTLEGLFVS
jgi:DNA polymerase elongation subunit (family B)